MRPKSILYQMQDAEHRWELSGISSPEDKHENNEIWHLERHQKYGATIGLGFAPLFLCDWKMKQWSAPPPLTLKTPSIVYRWAEFLFSANCLFPVDFGSNIPSTKLRIFGEYLQACSRAPRPAASSGRFKAHGGEGELLGSLGADSETGPPLFDLSSARK